MRLLDRVRSSTADCPCEPSFERPSGAEVDADRTELRVDATACPGDGDLRSSVDCRAAVIDALADRDADVIRTRSAGQVRRYVGRAAALLLAAGRFADRVAFHDERLAEVARRDPLQAAHDATGRAGPVAVVAAETGLAEVAARVDGYDDALRAFRGPTVARSRVATRPPADAVLTDRWTLPTGATVRIYGTDAGDARPTYHLVPVEYTMDDDATATLAAAAERFAGGGGTRAPRRAVEGVADGDEPIERIAAALEKHTRGHGVLDDLFADDRVSDVFVTAPAAENPVRVVVDGEPMRTNVRLTPDGTAALASRFRRASGRAFSRASPTLDAVIESSAAEAAGADDDVRVRVAGVSDPASDGFAFAFRRHDGDVWTLPGLVANGTVPADAAALLSVAVERAVACLVAGPRGAGKTTLLGALLWELPATTRTITIEDTPELPTRTLQSNGRDVQPLCVDTGDGPFSPTEALRTALRLGESALVIGEVRGEEAATLYEAMRVGANGSAVLGTIHGDGGEAVRERVVSDLDVPPSSFAATDLLVTVGKGGTGPGGRSVARVEEVRAVDGDVRFVDLYDRPSTELRPAGTVARGNSALVDALSAPSETYADLRSVLDDREEQLASLATTGRTHPEAVVEAYRSRGHTEVPRSRGA